MSVTAVVGAQWGDEGKGRIVDLLAQQADLVIRFQGGNNAGHTIVNEHGVFKLHLVPAGIFQPGVTCLIGSGTVVDPQALLDEMDELTERGISLDGLRISERAQLVLPYHIDLDKLDEAARGDRAIGTTHRGVGPAYTDKVGRIGLQVGDLLDPPYFRERLAQAIATRAPLFEHVYHAPVPDAARIAAQYGVLAQRLADRIVDPVPLVHAALQRKARIVLEGQLGVMRDLDWGIYPWVTSSNPLASGGATGAGIPPWAITDVVGVVKAFSTCVGAGPFPTELEGELADELRGGGPEEGWEFGATTGRPRRCGWLDLVAVRYGALLNGYSRLAVTKLDVLDTFPMLRICTGYHDPQTGRTYDTLPPTRIVERVEPVYEDLPGWQEPTSHVRHFERLPAAARAYLARIAELVGVPVDIVAVGPVRDQVIVATDRRFAA